MHWLVLFLLQPSPPPQQPIDLEWALALPLSPGAVALLVENPSDPRALERLSEALAHSEPEVRASAARVAYVSNVTSLLPDAEAALTRETEPVAASGPGDDDGHRQFCASLDTGRW
jgi:hypothetical protein